MPGSAGRACGSQRNGFFFIGGYFNDSAGNRVNVTSFAGQGFTGLSGTQIQAAALIHEMLHVSGVSGADSGPLLLGLVLLTARVRQACF